MSRLALALPLILALVHAPSLAAQATGPALASRFELAPRETRADVARATMRDAAGPLRPVAPITSSSIEVDDDAMITRRRRFAMVGGLAGAAAGVLVATRHDDDLGEVAFLAPLLWAGYAFVGATFGVAVGAGISFIVHPPRHTDRPML